MDTFRELVKDLVLNRNIKHKDLLRTIHDVILEVSKDLPTVKVLYNTEYGGFGYSKDFRQYLSEQNYEYDRNHRVEVVQYIQNYGECKLMNLRDILMTYVYYRIDIMATCATSTYYMKDNIQQKIDSYVQQFPTLPWQSIYKDVERYVHETISNKNKYQDKNALWHNGTFNKYAITYLLLKQHEHRTTTGNEFYDFLITKSILHLDLKAYDKLKFDTGLAFAASKYCKLDICEVPHYVDWTISQYDGKETVVFR